MTRATAVHILYSVHLMVYHQERERERERTFTGAPRSQKLTAKEDSHSR